MNTEYVLPKPDFLPLYEVSDNRYTLLTGDVHEVLPTLGDNSVDAVVTDPPYELGFMGKLWDATGIANDPKMWAEVLRVLKPGGHLLSFGGSRTYHRMASAIEDAGFEIRDQIMWVYGSGFPKSHNISKAIDKAGGGGKAHLEHRISLASEIRTRREAAGVTRTVLAGWFPQYSAVTANWERTDIGFRVPSEEAYDALIVRIGLTDGWREMVRAEDLRLKRVGVKTDRRGDESVIGLAHNGNEYESTTDLAKKWEGFGSALKPAHEPLVLARKPLIGTLVQNVLEHGTGAINIAACRVGTDPIPSNKLEQWSGFGELKRPAYTQSINEGRWPANVIHDGSDEVLAEFSKYGESKSTKGRPRGSAKPGDGWGMTETGAEYNVKGSPSRFFYSPKTSKKDRNEGCEHLEFKTAGESTGGRAEGSAGLNSPRAGAGRTSGTLNNHPTVKPTELMRYLTRLITPPGGIVLDPFMGSGSTGKAAMLEGFKFIGIDQNPEYVAIAYARISHAVRTTANKVVIQ